MVAELFKEEKMELEVAGMRVHVKEGENGEYLEITSDGPVTIKAPSITVIGNLVVQGQIQANSINTQSCNLKGS